MGQVVSNAKDPPALNSLISMPTSGNPNRSISPSGKVVPKAFGLTIFHSFKAFCLVTFCSDWSWLFFHFWLRTKFFPLGGRWLRLWFGPFWFHDSAIYINRTCPWYTSLGFWNPKFWSKLAKKVPLGGLKELVGFGKETLNGLTSFEAFLLGFLFRATKTQGPKAFDSGLTSSLVFWFFDSLTLASTLSPFSSSLALYGQLSSLCPTWL